MYFQTLFKILFGVLFLLLALVAVFLVFDERQFRNLSVTPCQCISHLSTDFSGKRAAFTRSDFGTG